MSWELSAIDHVHPVWISQILSNVLLLLLRERTYGKIERKTWRPRIHPPAASCRGGKAWRLLSLDLFLAPWTITGMVSCKFFGRSVRFKWRVAYLQLKVCDFPYGSDLVRNKSDLRPDVFPAVLAFAGDKREAFFPVKAMTFLYAEANFPLKVLLSSRKKFR